MKNLLFFILCISIIILTSCTGASDRGFDANRNSEHRSKIYPMELNNTDNDSNGIKSKPRNTPKASPTDEEDDSNKDLKWI